MPHPLRFVLGAAAAVLAASSFAQLPDPGNGDSERQGRMEQAYHDHQDAQSHPASFSESAHEAGHAVGNGARATGHFFRDGAKATGHAVHKGVKATGHAVHQGVRATGHAIHHGVDKVTGKE